MSLVSPHTIKPAGVHLATLQKAARLLKAANESLAEGKKQSEAAKETILNWLKEQRSIEVETLPIGEILILEGVCMIERGKQSRFDEKTFLLDDPTLHAKYKKDAAMTKFKVLV